MFVDRTALLWDLDPDKWTPEMLDKIAKQRQSGPVADVKSRLEAEEVTIETFAQDVTAVKRPHD